MRNISLKKIILLSILVTLFSFSRDLQINPSNNLNILGKWKYVKNIGFVSNWNDYEIGLIKSSILHIEKDKLYFDSPANGITDTCFYKNISTPDFFDRYEKEPNIGDDRALALKYNKKELASIRRYEFECRDKNSCLGTVYLKDDSLILNSCGGLTIYMKKLQDGR